MMDIVYILGKGSKWANNEIRFSLRSLEKNFQYGNVFVIGEKPDWMENVIHIPATDIHNNKIQNAAKKYLIACNDERISEDFILMNDDFFFLKPVKEIPYYSRGNIKDVIKKHSTKQGYYFDAIKKTGSKLGRDMLEHEVMDFEVHAPIIFNKARLKEIIESVQDGTICLYRTYYGNIIGAKPAIIKDFKAANVKEFHEEVMNKREFMSISDSLVSSPEFRAWIEDRFPKVSKYENDEGDGIKAVAGVSSEYRAYHASKAFDYGGKHFRRGELIDMTTMKSLKQASNMKHLWILK